MNDIKGFITFGPKDNFLCCVQIAYTPTDEQVENLRKMFGWDFMSIDEDNEYRYGR